MHLYICMRASIYLSISIYKERYIYIYTYIYHLRGVSLVWLGA